MELATLWAVMNVLGFELKYSGRTIIALKHWGISPAYFTLENII